MSSLLIVHAKVQVAKADWTGLCIVSLERWGGAPLAQLIPLLYTSGMETVASSASLVSGSAVKFRSVYSHLGFTEFVEPGTDAYSVWSKVKASAAVFGWQWAKEPDAERFLPICPPDVGGENHG